jgi:hypothetical protein
MASTFLTLPNSQLLMPQVWIAIFFVLLAGAELYQSIKDITLPFPVYLVLGVVLAVASNYQQQIANPQIERVTLQEIIEPDPSLGAVKKTPLLPPAEQPENTSPEISS